MKKNLKTLVEPTKSERPQCLVDMNEIDLIEASGMVADLRHKKSAHLAALWKLDQKDTVVIPMGGSNLEGFSQLTFWAYCEKAVGSLIRILFDTTPDGTGDCGYIADFRLSQKGWNRISFTMSQLFSIGGAKSWKFVSGIRLTRLKGRKLPNAALYLDSIFLWENAAPSAYELIPDLRRAVVFSEQGSFALVRGKKIKNAPFGGNASPMFHAKTAEFWVPFSPIVAGFVRKSEADSKRNSLSFSYRKHSYVFLAGTPAVRVDGVVQPLHFAPAEQGGGLYVPISYAAEFFGRKFAMAKGGLLAISNRKTWFLKSGEALRKELLAATCFAKIDSEELIELLKNKFQSPGKPRLLFSKDEVRLIRKSSKTDEKLQETVSMLESTTGNAKSTPEQKLLSASLFYLASGNKSLLTSIQAQFEDLTFDIDQDLAKAGHAAYALAMAYDLTKGVLTEAEKASMEKKLRRVCLIPGLSYYDGNYGTAPLDSPIAASFACGMTACALVMADAYPESAGKLLQKAIDQLRACFLFAKPNQKGSLNLLLGARALDLALGTTCGCSALPGVTEALSELFDGAPDAPVPVFAKLCDKLFTK